MTGSTSGCRWCFRPRASSWPHGATKFQQLVRCAPPRHCGAVATNSAQEHLKGSLREWGAPGGSHVGSHRPRVTCRMSQSESEVPWCFSMVSICSLQHFFYKNANKSRSGCTSAGPACVSMSYVCVDGVAAHKSAINDPTIITSAVKMKNSHASMNNWMVSNQ